MQPSIPPIWQHPDSPIREEELIAYFEGTLPPDRAHAVEQWLQHSPFEEEAAEGLSMAAKEVNLHKTAALLERNLQQQLKERSLRKEKRKIPAYPYTYVAVILILMLLILAYWIIQMQTS
jgi:anti-sigma factor RsiW